MQLAFVLVLALEVLGIQSGCYHLDGRRRWGYSHQYQNYNCVHRTRCYDDQYNLTPEQRWVTQSGRCSLWVDFGQVCCRHQTPPTSQSHNILTRTPIRNPSIHPMRQNPSQITLQNTNRNQLPHAIPNQPSQPKTPRPFERFNQSPIGALSLQPTIQGPSQSPTNNPLPQSRPSSSQIFPQNIECICTPFFRCFDEETSSNLNGVVDDRTLTQQSCPSPNDICCHNLIPPSSPSSGNPSPQSQSQVLSEISSSTNANCNCIDARECFDEDISSNLAGLIDVKTNRPLILESCPNSNHVCCHQLVHPLSTPTSNSTPQPQPTRPSQITTQRPTIAPSHMPQRPRPSQMPTQRPIVVPSPRPQTQRPAQISLSSSTNCLCTPFYKCYDEETSSNLTGIVNDRSFSPIVVPRTCSDPNEICCYNLVKPVVKPPTVSSSKDCTGPCVPIQDCPSLSNTLNEARRGKMEAFQELRKSVCSVTDGRARVCCHQQGTIHPFGVIFRDN